MGVSADADDDTDEIEDVDRRDVRAAEEVSR
jgi:hypothetical protein